MARIQRPLQERRMLFAFFHCLMIPAANRYDAARIGDIVDILEWARSPEMPSLDRLERELRSAVYDSPDLLALVDYIYESADTIMIKSADLGLSAPSTSTYNY